MLIDLSYIGLPTIDPSQYKTTLVVCIDAPDKHSGCGVLAGRYEPFTESERNTFLPVFRDDNFGLKFFHLNQKSKVKEHQILRWYYAAIGWKDSVYVGSPYSYEIILEELSKDDGRSSDWSVSVSGERGSFRLCLPDYEPDSATQYST
jgi:hypothetical protein